MKHALVFLVIFSAIFFTVGCLKDEVDKEKEKVDYETETRQWVNDTIFVWYHDLDVYMNVTGTIQQQFERVDTVLIDTIPNYFNYTFPNGQVVYYPAYLINIKCKSENIYFRLVKDIVNTKPLDYTEVRTNGNRIIPGTCGRQRSYDITHQYSNLMQDNYTLCKTANHQSGSGGNFLFINR